MLDLIKCFVTDKESFDFRTERKKTVSLISEFDRETGECKEYPRKGRFYNWELKITEKSTYLKGSLHKMLNSYNGLGGHNYNALSLCENYRAIDILRDALYIDVEKTKITNLEFGLNIPLEYDPAIFIDNCLLMHDYKPPTIDEKFKNKGNYKEFKRSDYSVKVYNKSKQYGLNRNILRVEVKIVKKRKLEDLEIYSLSDLYKEEAYRRLFEFLLKQFDNLLIIDWVVMRKALKTAEINLLKNYSNPHYWYNLKQELGSKGSKTYHRAKRDCYRYVENFAINREKWKIKYLLEKEYRILMNCDSRELKIAA